jgi:protein gp37
VSEKTGIAWTDHTFNPWIGCTHVSPGCVNCYAEVNTFTRAQRARGRELWGAGGDRHVVSEAKWREPKKWNAEASAFRRRTLVFCASMADVFEDRRDLDDARARLWSLIEMTPALTWQLLTKRPENADKLTPGYWVK